MPRYGCPVRSQIKSVVRRTAGSPSIAIRCLSQGAVFGVLLYCSLLILLGPTEQAVVIAAVAAPLYAACIGLLQIITRQSAKPPSND